MKIGDIILVPFPFSDLSGVKVRPSILLAVDQDDFVIIFITTIKPKGKFLPIKMDKNNNLKKDSFVRFTKIASIQSSLSLGKIGRLDSQILKEVKGEIKKFLQL
jgi:mRNA interferase MazF